MTPSGRRPYRAPQREALRNQTRQRIRSAARELFLNHGYTATTLTQVGEEAGVSRRYVQMTFGSKAELLSEVIKVAVAGDDAQVRLVQAEQRLLEQRQPRRQRVRAARHRAREQ